MLRGQRKSDTEYIGAQKLLRGVRDSQFLQPQTCCKKSTPFPFTNVTLCQVFDDPSAKSYAQETVQVQYLKLCKYEDLPAKQCRKLIMCLLAYNETMDLCIHLVRKCSLVSLQNHHSFWTGGCLGNREMEGQSAELVFGSPLLLSLQRPRIRKA